MCFCRIRTKEARRRVELVLPRCGYECLAPEGAGARCEMLQLSRPNAAHSPRRLSRRHPRCAPYLCLRLEACSSPALSPSPESSHDCRCYASYLPALFCAHFGLQLQPCVLCRRPPVQDGAGSFETSTHHMIHPLGLAQVVRSAAPRSAPIIGHPLPAEK